MTYIGGAPQWALTGECVKYILDFSKSHQKFNRYFKHVFAPDETYFHSVVYNSPFSDKTSASGAEPEKQGLVNWRIYTFSNMEKPSKFLRKKICRNCSLLRQFIFGKLPPKNLLYCSTRLTVCTMRMRVVDAYCAVDEK